MKHEGLHLDQPVALGYLIRGYPYRAFKDLFSSLREGRRDDNTNEPGRRKLSSELKHLDGLYEHEIGVDAPMPLPEGHTARVFL